jgi:Ataxin-3
MDSNISENKDEQILSVPPSQENTKIEPMPENIENILKRKYIYFEKQSNDRLCGVHCLNSLLQGPFFDPVSLSEIGQKLDEMEMNLYKEDPDMLAEILNKQMNGNVDLDGNYNIQVLTEALKIHNAEIVPVKQSECEKLLSDNNSGEFQEIVEAFIFNSSTHWFCIRKIENIWFNLNSTNPGPGPQIISDFYLSAFIKGTEELGYTNFLVKNVPPLPDLNSEIYKNLQSFQKLVPYDEVIKYKPKKINMGDSDDHALEKALELSKKDFENKNYNQEISLGINGGNDFPVGDEWIYAEDQLKDDERNLIFEDDINYVLELSKKEYQKEQGNYHEI